MKKLGLTVLTGLALAGCMTPRTGEFYQETKACRIEAWWALTDFDRQFSIYSLFTVPVKLLLQGVDIALINPVWDTVMAPVDLFYPNHARHFRVVDEVGRPVAGAAVRLEGLYKTDGWADYTCSVTPVENGTTDEDGRVSFARRNRNYEPFDCLVAAEGYHARRFVLHADKATYQPVEDADGTPVTTLMVQALRAPIDHPVRPFDVPVPWTQGEQNWVRDYDLAKGAWLPPYGHGEQADVKVMARFSKAKGTKLVVLKPAEAPAAFARVPMRPHSDPRFFSIDYEVPAAAEFSTEVCLQLAEEKHGNVLDLTREYLVYRIRRADGVHVGALVPTGLWSGMRNVYNPTPGSLSLEYR